MKIDPIPHVKIDPIPQQKQRETYKRNRNGILKVAAFLVVIVALLNWDNISDVHTVMTYNGDARVVALSDEAGMNLKGKALFFSHSPEIVNANTLHQHCPMENEESIEYGCYIPSEDKIYILDIKDEPFSHAAVSTAAHELLHVIWEDLSSDERTELSEALRSHLDTNQDERTTSIVERLALYDSADTIQIDEAHAFIGSELSEAYTSDELDGHYDAYFSDRNKSASAQERFDDGIDAKDQEFTNRQQALNNELSRIDDYERKWLTPFNAVLRSNAYYGDYYTYNKNVNAYNSNLKTYNGMVEAYEKLRAEYNADVDAYNAIMKAMKPDGQVDSI